MEAEIDVVRQERAGSVCAADGAALAESLDELQADWPTFSGRARLVAERYLARIAYRPAKRWELDSNEAIKRSVQAGLGIAFVSEMVVADELRRGELLSFRVEGSEPMRRAVQLLRPDGRDLTPSERAFVVTLCSCCDAQIAGCNAAPESVPAR